MRLNFTLNDGRSFHINQKNLKLHILNRIRINKFPKMFDTVIYTEA